MAQFQGKPGAGAAQIQIDGLKETAAAFRRVESLSTLSRHLRAVAEKVANDARAKVPRGKTGAAAASIRPRSSSGTASVVGGKKSVPYYGWLDFGTRDPRSGQPRSVGPWKGSGAGPTRGRFIYPAVDENEEEIRRAALKAVEEAYKEAGFR